MRENVGLNVGFSSPPQRDARSTGARPTWQSLLRGASLKCPACGVGALFRRYLKVADNCPHCGESLHHHRADDAPAYFTITIVGHVVVSLVLTGRGGFSAASVAPCRAVAAAHRGPCPIAAGTH